MMLTDVQEIVQRVVEVAGPGTVGIGTRWGRGSGLVIAPGRVLTNAHNAPGGEVDVLFGDGRSVTGPVVATDVDAELAVVEVDTGEVEPLQPGGRTPGLGAPVIALANPGGRGVHATVGLVSATGRAFRGPRGRRLDGAVEHTAPLVRGASGGPLLDTDGRLVAINTHRLDGGLYLALPADGDLRAAAERLERGVAAPRPRLGIAVAPAEAARRLRSAVGLEERDGLLVREVAPGGPAADAGLQRGDLIVAADGRPVTSVDDLHESLEEHDVTAPLTLGIVRGSDERELPVSLDRDGEGGPS